MLFFSKRQQLAEMYEKWAKENNVKDCAMSVISFLYANGLLDDEKSMQFLKRR